jgi:hypothetical protein
MRPTLLLLPLLTSTLLAIDPPGIEWARTYYEGQNSGFYHAIETDAGGFVAAGYQQSAWGQPSVNCLFGINPNGNLNWDSSLGWYSQTAVWIEQLEDGGIIAVGSGKLLTTSSYSFFMVRTDAVGTILWIQNYDISSSTEDGYCVQPLPDSGFAICGRKTVEGMGNQGWLLRTDSEGDTLWTREWGWTFSDRAMRLLYVEGGLTVLMHGSTPFTTGGPHVVRYDMDGDLLWEAPVEELRGEIAADMCYCSWDGGYTIVTQDPGEIAHVDSQGSFLWRVYTGSDGYSISTTMNGDYIYGGEKTTSTPAFSPTCSYAGTDSEWRGHAALFSQVGGKLWEDWIYELNCMSIRSIRQLSQGGYIAAGIALVSSPDNGAQLIRYTPETGIEEWEESTGETLSLRSWPNPSDGPVQISLTGPEGLYSLSLYDVSGRLVRGYPEVPLGGAAALVWDGLSDSGSSLPAGVYIGELHTATGSVSTLLMRF